MANLLVKHKPDPEAPKKKVNFLQFTSVYTTASVVMFFLTVAVYVGLLLLISVQSSAMQTVIEQIRAKMREFEPQQLEDIFLIDNRLSELQTLLARHVYATNITTLLENETFPLVRFTSLLYNEKVGIVEMTGETTSFTMIARQIAHFQRNPHIRNVQFEGLSVSQDNVVIFVLTLEFKPTLLQFGVF